MQSIAGVLACLLMLISMPARTQNLYDVVYGQNTDWKNNETPLTMDIYFPHDMIPGKKYPLVMQIHGGSFFGGRKEGLATQSQVLADSGFIAATINYRLGWNYQTQCKGDTATLLPAVYRAMQDANAAMRYLVSQSDNYNIDTNWLFVSGISAGAITAMAISYLDDNIASMAMSQCVYDLGNLNDASNDLSNSFTIKGISSIAGAVMDSSLIHEGKTYPTIFFQGDADEVIPVNIGTYLWCPNYNELYGSLCIYRQLCQYNESAYVHILHGGHHENSETTGYNDDFTMTNTACFFHKLMRGEKTVNNIFYDFEYSCDVPVQNAIELTYYRDKDEDGFGNINDFLTDTVKPEGYVIDSSDCDDDNNTVYPGAKELIDGIDNDCDGSIDEDQQYTFYKDADQDGFGNINDSLVAGDAPEGYVKNNTDGDDNNATVYPGAPELCDGLDNNCNGLVDDNTINAKIAQQNILYMCGGTQTVLNANTENNIAYQWCRNGVQINGATSSALSVNVAGNYSVQETLNDACKDTSAVVVVVVNPKPKATLTAPDGTSLCTTGTVKLVANTGKALTYQWRKNNIVIQGATGVMYMATTPGTYTVVESSTSNCSGVSKAVKLVKCTKVKGFDASATDDATIAPGCTVFPNPATDKINIHTNADKAGDIQISIFNIAGQKVYNKKEVGVKGINDYSVEVTNLSPGMYYVELRNEATYLRTKFLIQR